MIAYTSTRIYLFKYAFASPNYKVCFRLKFPHPRVSRVQSQAVFALRFRLSLRSRDTRFPVKKLTRKKQRASSRAAGL